jgi:hypothetical protein
VNRRLRSQSVLFLLCLFLPQSGNPTAVERAPIREALEWVRGAPTDVAQFDYVMSARVRLLFFWVGKDDVGGGYIRRGTAKDDSREEFIQLLFGSDPEKAPRAINRWGAGTEVIWHKEPVSEVFKGDDIVATAFFGFMKSSRGKSVSEMQEELKREKEQGEHQFTGILSRAERARAISLVVPLASNVDYNLHQYAEAEPLMLAKLDASDKPARLLENADGCPRAGEFLGTVAQLLNQAENSQQHGQSLCYVYDAQVNKLVVERTVVVPNLQVKLSGAKGGPSTEQSYKDLIEVDFVTIHQTTGKKVYFTILTGARGPLRGVPIQIKYQPNWWFQVVLNLLPRAGAAFAGD